MKNDAADGGQGRDRHGDDAPPPVRMQCRRPVAGERPPVVADEHRPPVAPQGLVQRAGVRGQRPHLIDPVCGDRGGGVAPHPRGHGVVSRLGQRRHQVPPGVGAVGEPVQTQCQGALGGPDSR